MNNHGHKSTKRPRIRMHTPDFSFGGRRYRVSLNAPWTLRRAQRIAAAANVFALKHAQKKPQFVYFLQCDDRVKIGIAHNPIRRLRSLQTGNATQFKILAILAGGVDLERAIHAKFESTRISGEWFRNTTELEKFIERAQRCDFVRFDRQENEIRMATYVRRSAPASTNTSRSR